MSEYVIFGDYLHYCAPRTDFKILDFVEADDAAAAFRKWKALLVKDGVANAEEIFEDEVYVMKVDGMRHVFALGSGNAVACYKRS